MVGSGRRWQVVGGAPRGRVAPMAVVGGGRKVEGGAMKTHGGRRRFQTARRPLQSKFINHACSPAPHAVRWRAVLVGSASI